MNARDKLLEEARQVPFVLDEQRGVRQRARLVAAVADQRSQRVTGGRLWAAAAVAGLAATVLVALWWAKPSERSAGSSEAVETAAVAATETWWERVPSTTEHVVAGKGEVQLEAGATAHLRSEGNAVSIVLDAGKVRSLVHPGRGTRWGVRAGAYLVEAVGTRFTVDHSGREGRLSVRVEEGTVRVSGGGLGGSEVLLHAGQSLRVEGARVAIDRGTGALGAVSDDVERDGDVAPATGDVPEAAGEDKTRLGDRRGAPSERSAGAEAVAQPTGPAGVGPSAPAERSTSWLTHHLAGEHQRALQVAVEAGFGGLLQEASCGDLSRLADTARLAGDPSRSGAALRASRERCAGTLDGARSAFLLGREADQGAPGDAVSWYGVYLKEAPAGPFAEQALGRRMTAYERLGQRGKAQADARIYLDRYPRGLYAEVARSLLGP
jgi:hypothetical protein